jgi:hypothetical protein
VAWLDEKSRRDAGFFIGGSRCALLRAVLVPLRGFGFLPLPLG